MLILWPKTTMIGIIKIQASESEDNVSSQLQSLREQVTARRSNIHDHVAQLEGFREEVSDKIILNMLNYHETD